MPAAPDPDIIRAEARRIMTSRGRACALELAGGLGAHPAEVFRALATDPGLVRVAAMTWAMRPDEGDLW